MTVASIDAETGKTVLISLPRNMQNFPFAEGSVLDKQFPDGFDVEGMYLNSVSTWALDHADLFAGSKSPGVDATIMGVEGITGLKMNYWAMVNLEGFKDLVDAVGGVELNVRQPIPVGLPHEETFHYIEAGTRTLEWSRHPVVRACARGLRRLLPHGPPEVRDERDAPADQPAGGAAQLREDRRRDVAMVSTDIPRGEVDRFVDLAIKATVQKIATLSLVPPMINTADPDIALVQSMVQAALDRSEGIKPAPATTEAAAAETPAHPPRATARRDPSETRQRDSDTGARRTAVGHRRIARVAARRVRRQRVRGPRRGLLTLGCGP